MKAIVNHDGTKAKPINPYTLEVPTYDKHGNIDGGYIDDDYIKFEEQYPERFLTIPQQPNSEIEVEPETGWQMYDDNDGYKEWIISSNPDRGWANGYITREAYKPIQQPKEKSCTKPNCDCVEKAIEANGGNDVKSYPCLHSNAHEAEKLKTGNIPNFEKLFSQKSNQSQSSNIESVEQALQDIYSRHSINHINKKDTTAKEAIFSMMKEFANWQKHQSNQEVVGWIKVSDKLPEPNVRVRAIRQFGNGKQEEIHTHYVERTQCFDDLMTDIITHWQPIILPKN